MNPAVKYGHRALGVGRIIARCLLLLALVACEDEVAEAPPPLPPPPGPPAAMTGHFCFETAELGPIRSAMGTPLLEAMVPASARDFLSSQLEGDEPAALVHVEAASRVCGLSLGQGDDAVIAAAGVSLPSPHPYGTWHSGAKFFGDVAVFGERSAVDDGGAYLARTLFATELDAPIIFHVSDGVLRDIVRPVLTESLQDVSTSARSAARAEEEARESAPDFGDPQVFIRIIERRLRGLLEWVPDLEEVEAQIRASGGALSLDIEVSVRSDSPLSVELQAAPTLENIFERLPRGAAFAYARAGDGESVVGALVEVAGARVSSDEAAALLRLADAMNAPFTFAFGVDSSPWLTYEGAIPSDDAIRDALGRPFARSLTAGLFDCARMPRRWPGPGEAARGGCALPPLHIHGTTAELGTVPSAVVGASPDIARLLADPPPALGGVYLDVLRVPAALSLFTALEERDLTRDANGPIVGTLHYDDESHKLWARVRFAPGSIASATDVALSLAL